jgi:hypothetical protein
MDKFTDKNNVRQYKNKLLNLMTLRATQSNYEGQNPFYFIWPLLFFYITAKTDS